MDDLKGLFDKDFVWGVSTAAAQIEGASNLGGKGSSIWDVFSKKPNKILNNNTPTISCNFYEHFEEDLALLKVLGFKNFRMSISWARILPNGTGAINEQGIDFYKKVFNACWRNDLEPWVTLYHWDLPQTLQNKGGWCNREILNWFEEFVSVCVNSFKGLVKCWMVLNEPMVFTGAGYFLGVHAPGKKGIKNFLPAMHHAVLCQAIGYNTIKKYQPDAYVGTTFSCSYITPKSNNKRDVKAALRIDALLNRLFIEPSLGMGYPTDILPFLKKVEKYKRHGDDVLMQVKFDFIGIQNYTREVVSHSFFMPYLRANLVPASRRKVYHTQMDWEVYPKALYQMIKKYSAYKNVQQIYITENGASFPDTITNERVIDQQRVQFFNDYIYEMYLANIEGYKVRGYFAWTAFDNFEWAEGYKQRFGLIHIDFKTQKRTIKDSGYWFQKFLLDDSVID